MLSTIFINHKGTKNNNKRGLLRTIIKGEDTQKEVFFQLFVSFPFLDKKFLRALESSFCLALGAYVSKIIPYGIRTRVLAMKRRCPIPLDERDKILSKKNGQSELRCNKKKWHNLRPMARLCATFLFHLPTIIHNAFNKKKTLYLVNITPKATFNNVCISAFWI
jgi:hypothetical protein